jgi:hypothetical protein
MDVNTTDVNTTDVNTPDGNLLLVALVAGDRPRRH